MTAIWTPSRELIVPKRPKLVRKVTEWCRVAAGAISTCGGTVNTGNGKISTNANEAGGCECSESLYCGKSTKRTLSFSGLGGSFSTGGYTDTSMGPSSISSGGFFDTQAGTGGMLSLFSFGVTGSANYGIYPLKVLQAANTGAYIDAVIYFSIQSNYGIMYCGRIPTSGGYLNPGTYPSSGCSPCGSELCSTCPCSSIASASLTVTEGWPAIEISSLPSTITVSDISENQYFSAHSTCSSGTVTGGGVGTLSYTACPDNSLYTIDPVYTLPDGSMVAWGVSASFGGSFNLGMWNFSGLPELDNWSNWQSSTLTGTYTSMTPCTLPSTITVT